MKKHLTCTRNKFPPKLIYYLIFFIIISCAIILRFHNLEADPDIRISGDLGIFTDEGLWSLSARNLAVFGEFNPNTENLVVESVDSPFYTFCQYFSFKLLGVNISALRLPSIFCAVLILVFTFLLMEKIYGKFEAFLALAFLSFTYMGIQYNRLALLENMVSLFLLLSAYFYLVKGSNKFGMIISGILFGAAITTKDTALFFLPAMLLSIAFGTMENVSWKINISSLAYFLFGITTTVIVNQAYLLFITGSDILDGNVTSDLSVEGAKALFYFGSTGEWIKSLTQILLSRFSVSMPFQFYFTFLYSILFLSYIKRPITEPQKGELLFIMWVGLWILFLSFFSYQPNRYRIPLIIPICALTAIGLSKIYRYSDSQVKFTENKYSLPIVLIGLTLIIFRLMRVFLVANKITLSNETILILSITISVSITIFVLRHAIRQINLSNKLSKLMLSIFVLFSLSFNLYQYRYWTLNPSYNILEGNEKIKKLVKTGTIGGQYAPILGFESNNILIPLQMGNLYNVYELNLTHYLDAVDSKPNDDYKLLERLNPGFLNDAKLITKIPIGFTVASLYSFPSSE